MKNENIKIIVAVAITFLLTITFTSIIPNIKSNNIKELKSKNEVKNKTFAVMLQGEEGYVASEDDTWPTSGYTLNEELTNCIDNSGTKIENALNYENGQVSLKSNKNLFCYLYFDYNYLSKKIISLSNISESNVYNEGDAGYRYEGLEVNNYISFNAEVWRIIGVEEGSKIGLESGKYYAKIIRNENFSMAYDSDNNHENDWSKTASYNTLNGDYFNKTGSYASTGLSSSAKNLMIEAKWYYSAVGSSYPTYKTVDWYNYERIDETKVIRDSVGMLSPSDYGYASPQSECSAIALNSYGSSCVNKNWIYKTVNELFKIPYSGNSNSVFRIYNGNVNYASGITMSLIIRPVVYLDYDILIINHGDGTLENKYEIGRYN